MKRHYAIRLSGDGLPTVELPLSFEDDDKPQWLNISIHEFDMEHFNDEDFPLYIETPVAECSLSLAEIDGEPRLLFGPRQLDGRAMGLID
jgi:hypothetical protein